MKYPRTFWCRLFTSPWPLLILVVIGFLVGCTSTPTPEQAWDGPARYECDPGHMVVRIIVDPDAPRKSPILLPINPCGFKS